MEDKMSAEVKLLEIINKLAPHTRDALLCTCWKDDIDIEEPTRDAELFAEMVLAAAMTAKDVEIAAANKRVERMEKALEEAGQFIEGQQIPDPERERVLDVVVAALAQTASEEQAK